VLAAIESIKEQQFSGIETILVDDGSTDDTVTRVAKLYPEIHLLKLAGVGPGKARHAGVAASTGDVLMFLDSDDLWLENHVRRLLKVLDRGFEVAYGITLSRNEIDQSGFLIPENGQGIEGDCFHDLIRWCFLVPSAVALTRKAYWSVGGFPWLPFGEDWLFFLKLAAQYHFGFAEGEPITFRRLNRDCLCFLTDKKKILAIIQQVLNFLKNEPRATIAHYRHFQALHKWTAENPQHWATVQDWYLALLKEKII